MNDRCVLWHKLTSLWNLYLSPELILWQTLLRWWTWTRGWTRSWWIWTAGWTCPRPSPQWAPLWRGNHTRHLWFPSRHCFVFMICNCVTMCHISGRIVTIQMRSFTVHSHWQTKQSSKGTQNRMDDSLTQEIGLYRFSTFVLLLNPVLTNNCSPE